jgi:hypothetical protein
MLYLGVWSHLEAALWRDAVNFPYLIRGIMVIGINVVWINMQYI